MRVEKSIGETLTSKFCNSNPRELIEEQRHASKLSRQAEAMHGTCYETKAILCPQAETDNRAAYHSANTKSYNGHNH